MHMHKIGDIPKVMKDIIEQNLGVDEKELLCGCTVDGTKAAKADCPKCSGNGLANASFVDDLGADSLDTVELVMAFEEEFSGSDWKELFPKGLEIADEDAEKLTHVQAAVKFVEEKAKA